MKKTILAAATALLMTTAYAQSDYESAPSDYGTGSSWGNDYQSGSGMGTGQGASGGSDTHMIESNVESLVRGAFSFDKSKVRGKAADNDTQLDLVVNYAYKFHRNWQLGTRLNYLKDTNATGDIERYGFQVGAFYNFSENLMQSFYISFFTGLEWSNFYGNGLADDEVWKSTLAVGKRFTLARWNVAHLTYSPEIALVTQNSNVGSDNSNLEYSQSVQLRFLQFSLFF